MQVHFRAIRAKGSLGWVYEQTGRSAFCCDDMAAEWGILIGFGVRWHERTISKEVNIFTTHHYPTGSTIPGITEIRFCPFCGEAIELIGEKHTRT